MTKKSQAKGKAPGRAIPGYSKTNNGKKVSDEQIKEYIIQIIEDEGYSYGYLKLTYALRRNCNLIINKKKVYRLCKELNILKQQRKIKPKYPRKLAKNRIVTGSNQLWEIDIKYGYIAGEDRFFYIMSMIDVADRNIIAYHIGLSCTAEDGIRVIKTALLKRQLYDVKSKPIIRSDNGPQYISNAYNTACKDLNIEHERIPYNTPNMNAYIEAYHRILEDECLGINEFENYAQAYREVNEFVKKYNTKRIHSSTKFMPPNEYYEYLQNTNEKVHIAL
ncbi:IS3 family transposase [Crassaminicella indica]|uniref:IS3 family transposase n=1 Tax=Crassaminicella indica TaxID=2855394 RepID=A0ABX8RBR8_9CLOT|nr:IS3 family transposase [Crassaminicella indica]QXM06236.1 IS3 family transposase [Crassaminicella indica]